jgi:redox-sensitive bicupin YhaK (pirin superfamily)
MTAGKGIVHSERTGPEPRADGQNLFGIQSWMALPKSHEESQPAFAHFGTAELPRFDGEGKRVRLIMGSLYGASSPAPYPHACFYAEAVLAPGAVLPLDPDYDERAIYIASGRVDIAGQTFEPGQLLVFKPGDRISILAETNARLMLLGGEPMDGPRFIWWNFVSSSKERIAAAKNDWREGRFEIVPGDEREFIPLPDDH